MHNGLYHLSPSTLDHPTSLLAQQSSAHLWHSRLGHPHQGVLTKLRPTLPQMDRIPNKIFCISCNMAKSHKLPFNKNHTTSPHAFYLVHAVVWGPALQPSINGFKYYIIFIDDFSKFLWLYLMNSKQETFSKFCHFCSMVQTQFHTTPKFFRSDDGGEFTSTAFKLSLISRHFSSDKLSSHSGTERHGRAQTPASHRAHSYSAPRIPASDFVLG
ncbi:hypothetical protein KFK09_017526 [Dendrobium nobile]|uniref:Integrase catalytic domain-containing protein n=1 Tax=Dendrobium nobile TaxID=94219 RepID=A0A8T3B3P2_DENNO|nr:hypothetical protein KFK09_017526 [Dendrobium nobile]